MAYVVASAISSMPMRQLVRGRWTDPAGSPTATEKPRRNRPSGKHRWGRRGPVGIVHSPSEGPRAGRPRA
jgi:hypothetical protein